MSWRRARAESKSMSAVDPHSGTSDEQALTHILEEVRALRESLQRSQEKVSERLDALERLIDNRPITRPTTSPTPGISPDGAKTDEDPEATVEARAKRAARLRSGGGVEGRARDPARGTKRGRGGKQRIKDGSKAAGRAHRAPGKERGKRQPPPPGGSDFSVPG